MELPNNALWDAFTDGHRFQTEDGDFVSTRISDAGALVLPTGRIVVSDPISDPFNKPLTVAVSPGAYPVLLSLIKDDIALVMVSFAEGTPVRWRATKPETFTVDSATGCLMDQRVARFLRRKAVSDKYEKYAHRFQNALAENEDMWGSYCLDSVSGANVVLFHTWGGDGIYASYFGYNAEGERVCLVTDLFLYLEHVLGSAPD